MNTLVADARARFDAFAGEAAAAVDAARSPERGRDEVREQLDEMLERDNWVATQRMMHPHHGGGRSDWDTAAAMPPHPAMFSRRAFRKYMDGDDSTASSETETGYDDSSSESERDNKGSRSRRRQGRHRQRHSSSDETGGDASTSEQEETPEQGQTDHRRDEAQTTSGAGVTAAGASDTEDGVQAGAALLCSATLAYILAHF